MQASLRSERQFHRCDQVEADVPKGVVMGLAHVYHERKRLLLVCFALTIAYGVASLRDSLDSFGRGNLFFDHGWPWMYMKRCVPEDSWGPRWQLWSSVYEFNPTAAVLNVVIAIAITSAITAIWHLHCVHRL